jgi:hypothetical protein
MFRVTTSEDKVIKIKKMNFCRASYFLGLHIRVRVTSRKVSAKKKVVHFGIPSTRTLLKTIKRFPNGKNKDAIILDISRRLFHADFSIKAPM